GTLSKSQKLLLHLVSDMRWKEPPPERNQEFLPRNILPITKSCAQCRGPPHIRTILQGERGQRNLLLLRTPDGTEDLLSLPYPSLCHTRNSLPPETRRSHATKLLHPRSSTSPLLLNIRIGLESSQKSRLGLRLLLNS